MRIKNTFLQGKMNKDSDERLVLNGQFRHAENIRVASSDGSDVGAIENIRGNLKITTLGLTNPQDTICLGMYAHTFTDNIYWFLLDTVGGFSFIFEYNQLTGIYSTIATSNDPEVLGFNKDYLITGINVIVDSDNKAEFLLWTDGSGEPKMVNIDRTKQLSESATLSAEDVNVIKKPPFSNPEMILGSTPTNEENNLEERFLRFAYRYEYLDGEKSALSSFTETAFKPKQFSYDYSTSSNESMINSFTEASIQINTGDKRVIAIDIVFKESGSNSIYLIDRYEKAAEGWDDDVLETIEFNNDKTSQLPENQLARTYDAVPLSAKAQELIGNRIIYGNYTSEYDIVNTDGEDINMDFELEKISTAIPLGTPTESVKSIRNYEVVMVYMDKWGRMTSGLTSKTNTLFVPNEDCVNKNEIEVTVKHEAPSFADRFRFFVKQSRYDYDTVVPTLFYEDGVYRWIKLEGNDINKVKEGDFLYVKSDTREVLNNIVQTKVLEVKDQERNFLEDDTVTETKQLSGKYFKIKPTGYAINEEDFVNYEFSSYDSSSNTNDDPIRSNVNQIEPAIYSGDGTLDDLTESGTYTNSVDVRYYIEIDGTGTPDTFRWKENEGGAWTSAVPITGAAQLLSHGISITFGATTGHDTNDKWVVSAKSSTDNGFGGSENSKAYAIFKSVDTDIIEGGARITIIYDEYNEATEYVEKTYISSVRYENLEEWFYGDNIQADLGIVDSRIWFRRGNVGSDSGTEAKHLDLDMAGTMCMVILSSGTQNNDLDDRVKVRSTLNIFQSDQNIIFETKEKVESNNIFYEVGRTYTVNGSNHESSDGGDTNQDFGTTDGKFILPMFNCFAWGNGFESYKIKDSFNAVSMKIDTRVSGVVENYRKNHRISSLTYSEVYEQSTNYNGLNEFNLSLFNWKDMDDKYQSIQKLYARDTDLTVYQEDKVHKVLYTKDVLFDADGSGNLKQSTKVLGQEVPYAGEYGISLEPESHAVYGNMEYFTDSRRGVVLRKSMDGLTEISNNGMRDWFRNEFKDNLRTKKIGAYDVYHDEYVLTIDDVERAFKYEVRCGTTISKSSVDEEFSYTVSMGALLNGTFDVDYDISTGSVDITVTFNGSDVVDAQTITGSGTIADIAVAGDPTEEITITIVPNTGIPDVSIVVGCMKEVAIPIVANDDLALVIDGSFVDVNVLFNDVFVDPVTVTIDTQGATGTATVNGDDTIRYTHGGANLDPDSFIYQIDDGNTMDTATVNMTIKATGGGGGGTGQDFNISSSSYFDQFNPSDGEGACPFILDNTKYHDGAFLQPTLANTIYNDINKTMPFDGLGEYWGISGGRTIKINSSGVVTDVWVCGAGNA